VGISSRNSEVHLLAAGLIRRAHHAQSGGPLDALTAFERIGAAFRVVQIRRMLEEGIEAVRG